MTPALTRLLGAFRRLEQLHADPGSAGMGESFAEQARVVAGYASALGEGEDLGRLVALCPSWPTPKGQPVPGRDLSRSPLMFALWMADPVTADDVYHLARLGRITGTEARARLVDALAFVDPGRLPAILDVLRCRVQVDRVRPQPATVGPRVSA